MKIYAGNIVDPVSKSTYKGRLIIENSKILDIEKLEEVPDIYILPGLIDSHIHIESSMLTPQSFSEIAIQFGTVATVSDPHEIANVLGADGIDYMIENAKGAKIKFFFGVPSCVPATGFESSGATINANQVESLLERSDLYFLSEMMNYPGVIYKDAEVHGKIQAAKKVGKKIDGHAPGLTGEDLAAYANAGISTDHECFTIEEARKKLNLGMIIQIREGSAAKNFEALYPLFSEEPGKLMLCSDDLHPDDLINGHINLLLKKCIEKGVDIYDALRSVTVIPAKHYNLNVGLLQKGDSADFILVSNITDFEVLETVIDGEVVFRRGGTSKAVNAQPVINKFYKNIVLEESIKVKAAGSKIKVIKVIDGELITKSVISNAKIENKYVVSDLKNDNLKIVVQNRYEKERASVAFIHGFGLKKGGMVSSIAHDSHNIIALGTNDSIISELINWVNIHKGGLAIHTGKEIIGLDLPVAGIMSNKSASEVAGMYSKLNLEAENLGCKLKAPFMTLSFMSLLVIPELKIGNRGLFDVKKFDFTNLFET